MDLRGKACRIRLIAMDVDGVLTDGSLYYTATGEEMKVFNVHDGMGVTLLHHAGIEVAIITGRKSGALAKRAKELKIRHLFMGVPDKAAALSDLCKHLGISTDEAAFVGDDLNDLAAFGLAGFSIAVADAAPELQEEADYVSSAPGGRGAIRDAVELILKHQGRWEEAVAMVRGNTRQ